MRFHELLTIKLTKDLQTKLSNQLVTPELLKEIHKQIAFTLNEVFSKSKYMLCEMSLSWLTDQFFKSIKINDETEIRDMVVTNEYSLTELPFTDIELMRNLFLETMIGGVLDEELKKRSLS